MLIDKDYLSLNSEYPGARGEGRGMILDDLGKKIKTWTFDLVLRITRDVYLLELHLPGELFFMIWVKKWT